MHVLVFGKLSISYFSNGGVSLRVHPNHNLLILLSSRILIYFLKLFHPLPYSYTVSSYRIKKNIITSNVGLSKAIDFILWIAWPEGSSPTRILSLTKITWSSIKFGHLIQPTNPKHIPRHSGSWPFAISQAEIKQNISH